MGRPQTFRMSCEGEPVDPKVWVRNQNGLIYGTDSITENDQPNEKRCTCQLHLTALSVVVYFECFILLFYCIVYCHALLIMLNLF